MATLCSFSCGDTLICSCTQLYSLDSVKRGKGCFLTYDGLADCYAFQPVPCFREGDKKEGRRQANTHTGFGADSTASICRQARHISSTEELGKPQSKFIHSSVVCSKEEGPSSKIPSRPSSKIPVCATQAHVKGNGSLWRAVQEGCCKALACPPATRCSEVSQR